MKTSIKTLTKSVLAAIVLSSAIFSTNVMADEKKPAKVSAPKNVSQVIVSGNVEVTLVQRAKEGISYNDDNLGKVKVTQDGYALKISSEDQEVAKVTVYVNNIYRVKASDHAVVKTQGKLALKYLQIFLNENAVAEINSDTESLYTVIENNADLKLSGATEKHTLVMGRTPKLNLDRFAALTTEMSNPDANALQTAALAK
ncbi:GIN domain-containing protein [Pedobacter vanadiisoli]|uniref:GIN domain-containing protein n=1 Tax=Pedobacter vanadiisoli TaxID=1761975 RepID=A0ABW5MFF2_9SPHI